MNTRLLLNINFVAGCEGRQMATSTVIPGDITTLKGDVSKAKEDISSINSKSINASD
ncbi:hypothetical protein HT118_06145 [Escherichia coli]|nr:hypothetical protein [Escherichia coli]